MTPLFKTIWYLLTTRSPLLLTIIGVYCTLKGALYSAIYWVDPIAVKEALAKAGVSKTTLGLVALEMTIFGLVLLWAAFISYRHYHGWHKP